MFNLLKKHFLKGNQKDKNPEIFSCDPRPVVVKGDYYGFIGAMRHEGWEYVFTDLYNNSRLLSTHNLEKNHFGVFLEIECPAGRILTIPGIEQFNFNKEHFSKYPNLYKYPYFFNLRCYGDDGVEPFWSGIIDIKKVRPNAEFRQISLEYYDDLHIKADSRYKRLEERYYFNDGVILYGLDRLVFSMVPDVDITNVEVFGKVDLFTKL